jgi:hypothetical protein
VSQIANAAGWISAGPSEEASGNYGRVGLVLKVKREAGQVFLPPLLPLARNPADLTEGGQPVVCWPTQLNLKNTKKVSEKLQKSLES